MTAALLRLILGLLVALAFCLPSSAPAARHVPKPRPDMVGRTAQTVRSDRAVLRLVFFWYDSQTVPLPTGNRQKSTLDVGPWTVDCLVAAADGSYWHYGYDSLGQVTNAVRRWSDNAPVSGQDYRYAFDNIGNRQRSEVSGQRSDYSGNLLNQYDSRTVPGIVNVTGLASNAATVSVGNVRATRQGDYFHASLAVSNSLMAVYTNLITTGVLKNAGPNGADIVATKTGTVFLAQSPEQFTHDADGNLTSDGRWQYTWDAENRLVGMETLTNLPASVPRQRLEFAYDASFRRISKKVYAWNAEGWQLTHHRRFLHSGWNLMAELDETNGVARSYLWGNDLSGTPNRMAGLGGLLAMQSGTNGVHIALSDGNGHVTALVAAEDGAVSAQYEYGVFGEPVRVSGPAAASNPIRYASKYWDLETGLIAYPFRWYDPLTGRWRSRDPIGESGGANLHGFVNNDPINFADPTGEHPALLIAIGLLWLASEQVAWAPTGQETAEQIRAVERANLVGNARTMSMVVALPCSALAGTVTRTGLTRVLGEEALRGTGARVVAWGGQTLAEGATFGALVNVSGQVASGRWDSRSFVEETAFSAGGWVLLKGIGTVVMQGGRQVLQRFEFSGQNAECLCVEAASSTPRLTKVTSWAGEGFPPDLNPGRWVQLGEATKPNFWKTGLPGPKATIRSKAPFLNIESSTVPFENSITAPVPTSSLQWPQGWEWWKGIFGQRQIKP